MKRHNNDSSRVASASMCKLIFVRLMVLGLFIAMSWRYGSNFLISARLRAYEAKYESVVVVVESRFDYSIQYALTTMD